MDLAAATLGGLWHDIGKFAQRGMRELRRHTDAGAEFYARHLAERVTAAFGRDVSLAVERAIRDHHSHAELITLADHVAAGERFSLEAEEGTQDPRRTLLAPILAQVALEGVGGPPSPSEDVAPRVALGMMSEDPEILFPARPPGDPPAAYAALWAKFLGRVEDLPRDPSLLDASLDLLEDFTWCIPSAAYVSRADVSLFDHLRLTAAVAACLASASDPSIEKDLFTVVLGDLSGIQSYLFALRGARGAAKRLRARSQCIADFARDAARDILTAFGLHRPNLLMAAGGRFYLLVPNRPHTDATLRRRQCELDRRCLDDFGSLLSLRLAWRPCSGRSLSDFGPIRQRLEQDIRLAKSRPLSSVLQGATGWDESAFLLQALGAGQEPCPICQLRPVSAPAEGAEPECARCRADRERGARLAREGPHYVPSDDGAAKEFESLAAEATGRKYLAVLKADVDRLGRIFDQGLAAPEAGGSRITLSRIMAASRSLDAFFTGWLPAFLRAEHPDVYTVFAGGDDMILVGPWDDVVALAAALNARWRDYVAGNSAVTWSAGIALFSPHVPIRLAIEEAARLLEQAKESDALGRAAHGRNQVACLGTVLPWSLFHAALDKARCIARWACDGEISRGLVQTLMRAARMHQRFRIHRDLEMLRWVPLLAYQIGRLLPPPDKRSAAQQSAADWLISLKEQGLRDPPPDRLTDLDALRLVADYAAVFSWTEEVRP